MSRKKITGVDALTEGSNNDVNVLRQSPVLNDLKVGKAPEVPFVANDVTYKWGYYLTDGIYPKWVVLMKSISYALTHNPAIYDSLVKQFWQTVTLRTLANGTQQLIASIDSTKYNIIEASVRRDFVPLLPVMLAGATMDPGEGSAQTAEPHHTPVDPPPSTSLPHQPPPHSPYQSPPHSPYQSPPHSPYQSPPHSPPHYSPPRSCEAPLPKGNTSGSAEDSMQLKELMDIVPKLVTRIKTLETELQQTKTTYGKAVLTLVKRVKILENALNRKTQKMVISESEGEEPEDQGRMI
ncbi:ALP1-like protein isoform X1 [Tanacetum coccineum]